MLRIAAALSDGTLIPFFVIDPLPLVIAVGADSEQRMRLAAMLDGQLTPDTAAKQAQADVEEIVQSIE